MGCIPTAVLCLLTVYIYLKWTIDKLQICGQKWSYQTENDFIGSFSEAKNTYNFYILSHKAVVHFYFLFL